MSLAKHIALLAACLCLAAAWAAPASASSYALPEVATAPERDPLDERVVSVAMSALGAPYRWGGVSPTSGFDCSGFVLWTFSQLGLSLPHNELGQLNAGARVGADELLPGDVVVFKNTYKPGPSHTGIFIGGGQFIHAADTPVGVVISNLWDSYWGPRFVAGVRLDLPAAATKLAEAIGRFQPSSMEKPAGFRFWGW